MKPLMGLLSADSYHSSVYFEKEAKNLFARAWEFAGFTDQVSKPNDYFLVQRAGVEIVVQNCRGEIKAFRNMCPHRFSRIHSECKGNRPLSCPYHGWSFNHEGKLLGLPRGETFANAKEVKERARLKEYPTRMAGRMIFVARDPQGPTFEEFFGAEASQFLQQVGEAIDQRLDHFVADVPANWKIAIENSLEGYHVPLVHPETLSQFAGMSKKSEDVVDHIGDPDSKDILGSIFMHNFMKNRAESDWLRQFMKITEKAGRWPFTMEGYIHHLFFPNLTITSFLGYSFHIQHFEAVGPELTRVQSNIYSSRFDGGNERVREAIFRPMFNENVKFTHLIFKEDEGAIAGVVAGVRNADQDERSVFSSLEQRIYAFQKAHSYFMDKARE